MRVFTGKVVSTKMAKTAVVEVVRVVAHPVYKKRVRTTRKYHVHDELGVHEGEVVRFVETKPISKTKKWKIIEVVGKEKKRGSAKK
jgi:small subunit ribosomal protein S17